MKKLFVSIAMLFCAVSMSFATSHYQVNAAEVDALIANAEEVSFSAPSELNLAAPTAVLASGKTVGGYLVRAFFCGAIGLHRYYMGTNGKSVWWWYLCVPVAGGITGCVDFWGVVFKGEKQLNKYANNSDLVVWW